MEKLISFIRKMDKIGIKLTFSSNYPWVYLDTINGKKVKETYHSEHGYLIGYSPIKVNQHFEFDDLHNLIELIRIYINEKMEK